MSRILFLAVLLLLVGCGRQLSPLQQLSSDIDGVKLACENACASRGSTVVAELTVPANATAYFTDEALCAKAGARLFCARCSCGIIPEENLTPGRYACSFNANETGLLVRCGQ